MYFLEISTVRGFLLKIPILQAVKYLTGGQYNPIITI